MYLKDDLLDVIHERAPHYDKENTFPYDDYRDLKEAGYYKAFVPKEYGGHGLSLKEIAQEQMSWHSTFSKVLTDALSVLTCMKKKLSP